MLQIIQTTRIGNGNGPGVVNGRGLRHRKMTPQQGAKLATDAVLGLVQITPSIQQAATMVPNVRPEDIRAELRARTEATELYSEPAIKNGGSENGKGGDAFFTALPASVEEETALVFSPEKLTEVFTKIADKIGHKTTLDILTMIERANSVV